MRGSFFKFAPRATRISIAPSPTSSSQPPSARSVRMSSQRWPQTGPRRRRPRWRRGECRGASFPDGAAHVAVAPSLRRQSRARFGKEARGSGGGFGGGREMPRLEVDLTAELRRGGARLCMSERRSREEARLPLDDNEWHPCPLRFVCRRMTYAR
jgi:hypothetical protein